MTKNEIERIVSIVCDELECDKTILLSKSRTHPLPIARGILWYAISRMTNYSNGHIAKITAANDYEFTSVAIGQSIARATDAISTQRYWSKKWNTIANALGINNTEKQRDMYISLTMEVPHGMKDKVKINIKEKLK